MQKEDREQLLRGFRIGFNYPLDRMGFDDMSELGRRISALDFKGLIPTSVEGKIRAAKLALGVFTLGLLAACGLQDMVTPTAIARATETPRPVSSPVDTEVATQVMPTDIPTQVATSTLVATERPAASDTPPPSETPIPDFWENAKMAGAGGEVLPDGWKLDSVTWNPNAADIRAFADLTGNRTYADFESNVTYAIVQPDQTSARTFISAPRPAVIGRGSLDESLSENNSIYAVYPQGDGTKIIFVNAFPSGGSDSDPLALFLRPQGRTLGMGYVFADGSYHEEGGHVSLAVPLDTEVQVNMQTFQVVIVGAEGNIVIPFGNDISQSAEFDPALLPDGSFYCRPDYCFGGKIKIDQTTTSGIQRFLQAMLASPTNGPILRNNGILSLSDLAKNGYLLPGGISSPASKDFIVVEKLTDKPIDVAKNEFIFAVGDDYEAILDSQIPQWRFIYSGWEGAVYGTAQVDQPDGTIRYVHFVGYNNSAVTDYPTLFPPENIDPNNPDHLIMVNRWYEHLMRRFENVGLTTHDQSVGAENFPTLLVKDFNEGNFDNELLPVFIPVN